MDGLGGWEFWITLIEMEWSGVDRGSGAEEGYWEGDVHLLPGWSVRNKTGNGIPLFSKMLLDCSSASLFLSHSPLFSS